MSNSIGIYQLISDEEKQMLRDTPPGDEYHEAFKGLRQKYFAKINSDFSQLHVDNQRRLRELFTIVEKVVDTMHDCGDVWISDYRTLANRLSCLDDFITGDIGHIEEGVPE